jgi:hypothetical protein
VMKEIRTTWYLPPCCSSKTSPFCPATCHGQEVVLLSPAVTCQMRINIW